MIVEFEHSICQFCSRTFEPSKEHPNFRRAPRAHLSSPHRGSPDSGNDIQSDQDDFPRYKLVKELINQVDLWTCECQFRCGFRHGSIHHGHPEYPPAAEEAENRERVDDQLGRPQPYLFSFEAYFRILWKVSIFHRKAISLNTPLASDRLWCAVHLRQADRHSDGRQ